jgi:hypothetical protein
MVVAGDLDTGGLVIFPRWRCLRDDIVIKILNNRSPWYKKFSNGMKKMTAVRNCSMGMKNVTGYENKLSWNENIHIVRNFTALE